MEQFSSPQPMDDVPGAAPGGPGGPGGAWVAPEEGTVLPQARRGAVAAEPPTRPTGGDRGQAAPSPRLPVPLRPMTISDILDGAFGVMKARPASVLLISAATVLPVQIFGVVLLRETYLGGAGSASLTEVLTVGVDTANVASAPSVSLFVLLLLHYASQNLMLFFLGGAVARLVSAWYAGGDITPGRALGASFRRGHIHLAAWAPLFLLKAVCTVLAYCLIGLAALPFVVTVFSLTAIVIVVEQAGPLAAMARSWRLVMRRFFPVLLATLGATLATGLASFAFGSLPAIIVDLVQLGEPYNWILVGVFSISGALVVYPILAAASVLIYLDLRVRTEGLDIEIASVDAFATAA